MLQKFIYCPNCRYRLHISFIFLFYYEYTIEIAFIAIYNNTKQLEKETKMKKMVLLAAALMLMATGAVYARGFEINQKAGDYNVEIMFDKNPLSAGNNGVEIAIRDASGKSVTDAKVMVIYSMPAMPGMPAMNYKTAALLTGAKYAATLNLSMSGSWNVAVKIARAGKTSTVKFNVDAQ